MRTLRRCSPALCLVAFACSWVGGCSKPAPQTPSNFAEPATFDTPACAGAPQLDPLVTEWPASEKARLQSVLSQQPVAVRYTGCELQILDDCKLPGAYAWKQSPVTEDSLSIDSKEELAAKLPLGGYRLEAELEHSGGLLVTTTVSGRFELTERGLEAPDIGPCAQATHLIHSMVVGSFSLISRAQGKATSAAQVPLLEIETRATRDEHLLREAGVPETCASSTELAPAKQCGSPIRVVLRPLRQQAPKTRLEQAQKSGEVFVHIPLAQGDAQHWALHDGTGTPLCELPCSRWLRPSTEYSLRRRLAPDQYAQVIPITGGFPVAPGQTALGLYHTERGSPDVAGPLFWVVGTPSLVFGGLLTLGGGISLLTSPEEGEYGMFATGVGLSALGGGLWWWYDWSHEASFEVRAQESGKQPGNGAGSGTGSGAGSGAGIGVGPGMIGGQF